MPFWVKKKLFNVFFWVAVPFLLLSCASIDKSMMAVSEGISSKDPVTGKREVNLVSEQEEIEKAASITNDLLSKARKSGIKIDEQTAYYERVEDVFSRLIKVVHRRHLPWEIHVLQDDNWNAFTVGGGKVFVFTGLLEGDLGLRSDDELAAVLAHEMAHVAARHASEKTGKLGITKLVDKNLRTSMYDASFTTNQEDEADRYSVIYSALAGYDPSAAVSVWNRMYNAMGGYSGSLLYDHPLNDDRAKNLERYSKLAQKYYEPGKMNARHDSILENNSVFFSAKSNDLEAGKGGGLLALLEVSANTFTESLEAKAEQRNRQLKQQEEEIKASKQLLFKELKIGSAQGGGKGLFGYSVNPTSKKISGALVKIVYLSGKKVVHEDEMKWSAMKPYEKRSFGVKLKPIRYTAVSITAKYVQLSK